MRILVRTAGLILIALGLFLWESQRKAASEPTSQVIADNAPTPPPAEHWDLGSAHHSKTETAPTQPAASPVPATTPASPTSMAPTEMIDPETQTEECHSTVKPAQLHRLYATFVVGLCKPDGWFDTKIPISPGVRIDLEYRTEPVHRDQGRWVEARVGETGIAPAHDGLGSDMHIKTFLQQDDPSFDATGHYHYVPLPETNLTTLKLRIVPDSDPNDIEIHIMVSPLAMDRSRPSDFSPIQRLEQDALKNWRAN